MMFFRRGGFSFEELLTNRRENHQQAGNMAAVHRMIEEKNAQQNADYLAQRCYHCYSDRPVVVYEVEHRKTADSEQRLLLNNVYYSAWVLEEETADARQLAIGQREC